MSKSNAMIESAEDLTESEAELIRYCAGRKEDLVYLVDITTALAGLPKSLAGQWFDEKLLTPRQKEGHRQAVKDVNAALRRLYRAGLIDVAREDASPEGFRRHHDEIIAAMRDGRYWLARPQYGGKTPALHVVEENVAHHETWATASDLRAVVRELGGPVQMVGLTARGREIAAGFPPENGA